MRGAVGDPGRHSLCLRIVIGIPRDIASAAARVFVGEILRLYVDSFFHTKPAREDRLAGSGPWLVVDQVVGRVVHQVPSVGGARKVVNEYYTCGCWVGQPTGTGSSRT